MNTVYSLSKPLERRQSVAVTVGDVLVGGGVQLLFNQ